jgi:uroporphyrinogen-III synthase
LSPAASFRRRTKNALKARGIAAVFSPKDYDLNAIMREIVGRDQIVFRTGQRQRESQSQCPRIGGCRLN